MKPYVPPSLPLQSLNWALFVRYIGQANAALARYDGVLQGIVNPAILLSPLTTQEAVLSSRIEGTEATLEEVLEFEAAPEAMSPRIEDIKEIINYRTAMSVAVNELRERPISLNMVKRIHAVLLESVRGQNKARGEFRRVQNWIGRPGSSIEDATFVPPSPHNLMDHLTNLENYVHYDEKDRLVQLAIIHAQFELIHPFLDGNGRVGRILIPLFLHEKKLLSSPMFYLSSYLEANRDMYYNRLKGISEKGDWDGWIRFFLEAIVNQSKDNCDKAMAILSLYDRMKHMVPDITHSQYSIQAIDTMFGSPVFTTTEFVRRSQIPKVSAMRMLSSLQEHDILICLRESRGRRPAMLMFRELIYSAEGR